LRDIWVSPLFSVGLTVRMAMTTATGTGVLQRMVPRQQLDAPDVPLTASRAARLALARGAQTSTGLPINVGSVAEQALPLDVLLTEASDDLLLLLLSSTRDGAICGLLACDAVFVPPRSR
jgi:flagellar motor switch protein FliM